MLTLISLISTVAVFDVRAEEAASRFSLPEPDKVVSTVGMSEKMGFFGLLTKSAVFERGANEFHVVGGTSLFFGGVGGGWRFNLRQGRIVPFTNFTAVATYFLPMCGTDNCGVRIRPYLFGSFGLDMVFFDGEKFDLHLVLGVMSIFDVWDLQLFESPSDRPAIWPVFNLGWSR